jgi:predicted O-methyltransferase YrrM
VELQSVAVGGEGISVLRAAWRAARRASAPLRERVRRLRGSQRIQRTAVLAPEDRTGKRRRQHVLVDLVNERWPQGPVRIAEIGAGAGNTSAHLLKYCSQITEIVAVDLVEPGPGNYLIGEKRVRFEVGCSDGTARLFEDEYFELVFIDADHSEESVSRDIVVWLPKVKRGGVIAGHDYGSRNWPGVKRAVDRCFSAHQYPIRLEANKVWWTVRR